MWLFVSSCVYEIPKVAQLIGTCLLVHCSDNRHLDPERT